MPSAYSVPFLEAIKVRRSILSLTKESPISDDRIVLLVQHAIKHAPSPFSVQSCRAIVLFGEEHEKLWDFALKRTRENLPPAVFETFEPKIKGERQAYGTVLPAFYKAAAESLPDRVKGLLKQYPEWYEHANGMAQFVAWTALATEGLGCNLQHYNPSIDKDVKETWNVPESWTLRAQLVFGKATGPPRGGVDKVFAPLEPRVLVYGRKD
ncbi:hypothetical protein C0995_000536 [Termitomyces sp. Mi166|nr:hypothetical protein C0995_000536 [Termitomyces sp. Mi166\